MRPYFFVDRNIAFDQAGDRSNRPASHQVLVGDVEHTTGALGVIDRGRLIKVLDLLILSGKSRSNRAADGRPESPPPPCQSPESRCPRTHPQTRPWAAPAACTSGEANINMAARACRLVIAHAPILLSAAIGTNGWHGLPRHERVRSQRCAPQYLSTSPVRMCMSFIPLRYSGR